MDRGQATQLGLLLLASLLIIFLATYTAVVVPEQRQTTERDSYLDTTSEVTALYTHVHDTALTATPHTTTLALAPDYPVRWFVPQPPTSHSQLTASPAGTYRIDHAQATAATPDIADYWDGQPWTADTQRLTVAPDYHEFTAAPLDVAPGNLLTMNGSGNPPHPLSAQPVVDGTTITLVRLQSSINETGTHPVVRTTPRADTYRSITVTNTTNPITITIPTHVSVDTWRTDLLAAERRANGGHITEIASVADAPAVQVTLEPNQTYRLRVPVVTVTTDQSAPVREPTAAYLSTPADTTTTRHVQPGTTVTLPVHALSHHNEQVAQTGLTYTVAEGDHAVEWVRQPSQTRTTGKAVPQLRITETAEDGDTVRVQVALAANTTPAHRVTFTLPVTATGR